MKFIFFFPNIGKKRVATNIQRVLHLKIKAPVGYRYGFNGKEKLDELHGNSGDSYDFGARIYDARLGRWLALDPIVKESESPYAWNSNNPIFIIDVDGRDSTTYLYSQADENGKPKFDRSILEKIAKNSEKVDRLNGINYTKYKVFSTKSEMEAAAKSGEIKLNALTDLAYEVTTDNAWIDHARGRLGTSERHKLAEHEYFNGVELVGGVIRLDVIQGILKKDGEALYINAGITLAHERIAHGYGYILERITGHYTSEYGSYSGHYTGYPNLAFDNATLFYGTSYLKLRTTETVRAETKSNMLALFSFAASPKIVDGTLKPQLGIYSYIDIDQVNLGDWFKSRREKSALYLNSMWSLYMETHLMDLK